MKHEPNNTQCVCDSCLVQIRGNEIEELTQELDAAREEAAKLKREHAEMSESNNLLLDALREQEKRLSMRSAAAAEALCEAVSRHIFMHARDVPLAVVNALAAYEASKQSTESKP